MNYPNGGNPLSVTYRDDKAVEIKPGPADLLYARASAPVGRLDRHFTIGEFSSAAFFSSP